MPEMAPSRVRQIPDASPGNSGERAWFSPEVSYAPTGLSFPSARPRLFLARAKDKPRSPHRGSTCTPQELVKYKAENVRSKSLPDFS